MPKTPDIDVAHPQLQFLKKESGTKVMPYQAQDNRSSCTQISTLLPFAIRQRAMSLYATATHT